MRILTDTNVLIDALKKKRGRGEFLEALPRQGFTLCTCAVVLTELYSGIAPADRSKAEGMTGDFLFLSTNA